MRRLRKRLGRLLSAAYALRKLDFIAFAVLQQQPNQVTLFCLPVGSVGFAVRPGSTLLGSDRNWVTRLQGTLTRLDAKRELLPVTYRFARHRIQSCVSGLHIWAADQSNPSESYSSAAD